MIIPSYSHIKSEFSKLKTCTGKLSPTKINSKQNYNLRESILSLTSFLPSDRVYSERIFCIENDIYEIPTCIETGAELKWSPKKQQYNRSRQVAYKNRQQDFSSISKRYKDIEHVLNNMFRSKTYNLVTYNNIREKINLFTSNIKHWDIEKDYNFFCSVLEYTSFLMPESNWGERFFCIKNNITSRIISKDGGYATYINSHVGYSLYSSKEHLHKARLKFIIEYVSQRFTILDDLTHIQQQKRVRLKCRVCNYEKLQLFTCGYWQDICCNKCTGYGINRSKAEDDITEFIQSNNINVETNIRTFGNFEVDIFIPEKRVAVEYNGVLWHSYGTKFPNNQHFEAVNKSKDIKKKLELQKHDINLLTIFENEWLFKTDIVKSIILSKLGIYSTITHGRKCEIRLLTKQEKSSFYNLNHIQGNCQSFYDIGLIYNNEIISALSFSRRKISKQSKVELVRFCNKLNNTVVGGFSKLFKHATNYLKCDIISYCDLRYSNGDLYLKNNFKLIRRSVPNYFYTKDCIKLEGRLNFQKHKLVKFKSFQKDKTETEIMYEEGYRKIYDCGNLVFLYQVV